MHTAVDHGCEYDGGELGGLEVSSTVSSKTLAKLFPNKTDVGNMLDWVLNMNHQQRNLLAKLERKHIYRPVTPCNMPRWDNKPVIHNTALSVVLLPCVGKEPDVTGNSRFVAKHVFPTVSSPNQSLNMLMMELIPMAFAASIGLTAPPVAVVNTTPHKGQTATIIIPHPPRPGMSGFHLFRMMHHKLTKVIEDNEVNKRAPNLEAVNSSVWDAVVTHSFILSPI